jgi:predicted nucleotidyltransferase
MSVAADVPWAVTPEKVEAVVRRLVEVARPRKIILFGSFVRGETNRDSDLDVLVVTDDDLESPHAESVRLRRSVRDILMPMDILVIPQSKLDQLRHRWDLVYYEACETGRVVYERDAKVA